MIGYKVLTSSGLKGPFMKSSLIKAITSAMVPLQARVLELETNRYLYAADLVGETIDPKDPTLRAGEHDLTIAVNPGQDKPAQKQRRKISKIERKIAEMAEDRTMAMSPDEILAATRDKLKQAPKPQLDEPEELRLDEETPGDTDTPRVILRTNPLLAKHVRMPKRRKLSEKSEAELDHSAA